MQRIEKENYYLDIAETVLERSTCLRRQYGAIIVRNDEIVAHRLQWRAQRQKKLLRPRQVRARAAAGAARRAL